MAKPLPLPVWDRQRGTLLEEWMDDHQPHYESQPQRSFTQWVKSQPVYDRLYALYENSRLSTREIEPFIRKYHINMAEFEPARYRSFAEFFDRRFRPGVRKFPQLLRKWARSPKPAILAGRMSSRIRGSRLRAIH